MKKHNSKSPRKEKLKILIIETNLDDKLKGELARKLGEELVLLSDVFQPPNKT